MFKKCQGYGKITSYLLLQFDDEKLRFADYHFYFIVRVPFGKIGKLDDREIEIDLIELVLLD